MESPHHTQDPDNQNSAGNRNPDDYQSFDGRLGTVDIPNLEDREDPLSIAMLDGITELSIKTGDAAVDEDDEDQDYEDQDDEDQDDDATDDGDELEEDEGSDKEGGDTEGGPDDDDAQPLINGNSGNTGRDRDLRNPE